ncbi:MAG TPA: DNA mismatch repair endonuclease MutL [Gemmatimonadales bacterium]|jgi:DNA mismatch repair protein MutL
MPRIAVLSETVADQIAAGEVVERPASVVKELVENALDAGASSVEVVLEGGGRTTVRVSDNGEGMDADDATMALMRHATSKIHAAADLIAVATYGFRGEALPAIASVAQLELESAPRDGDGMGTRVRVRGGRVEGVERVARSPGTVVTVTNLFFNTPARRKFLRSQRSETRAAVEAMIALALGRLDVAFTLTSDGRVLVDAPVVTDPIDRVAALFGRAVAEQLLEVGGRHEDVTVRGFVQRPAHARPAGRKSYLFVNGRPFRDPFLVRAAEAGYRATLPVGHRPTIVLSVELPGDRVDVNVHPAKLEVRFRDKWVVETAVERVVREALRPLDAAPQFGPGGAEGAEGASGFPGASRPWSAGYGASGTSAHAQASLFAGVPAAHGIHAQRPVFQAFNTYLIFQSDDSIAIVDQHSAHERVLYERAMRDLSGDGAASQHLLLPLTIELNTAELEALDAHTELLRAVGFEVEPFGGRSVVVHAVPNPHPRFDALRCFEELVTDLARNRLGSLTNRLERFASTYACRAAIKAGQPLESLEMRTLLDQLFACELPPHDVHGRPTIVQLPQAELERRFGRS